MLLGSAVIMVMLVTTFLMVLVMLLVWRCHWILILIFTVLSLIVEGTYFSSLILKINRGGWVPLVIAVVFFIIMSAWHYGTVKRHQFELQSKVSIAWILGLGPSLGLVRVPGIGLVYTELPSGVPHIFSHFITNLPAIHSVLIFVCVKYLPVYTVPEGERFLFTRIGPKNFHMFHCVARYGYKDNHKKDDDFEQKLFDNLFRFVRMESLMDCGSDSEVYSLCEHQSEHSNEDENGDTTSFVTNSIVHDDEVDELEFLKNGRDIGVVHILGNTVVMARRDSELYKKIDIDYIYTFLRKLCRSNSEIYEVPHESLLNVGQVVFV
ncbi:hypothetical protein Dsin_028531 [Dipteronia sinensis]|uniref:Potassium transporter n=1 Tax=Dipteronia sinensis TaxID=43782 RepID=A0AAD9ZQR3_9ROSI|nr:hypothetical protein Dsin_028531 [Dipteronia sinensis]